MSTICKMCLLGKEEATVGLLGSLLVEEGSVFECKRSEWPLAGGSVDFLPNDAMPTVFSVKQLAGDLVEIHFNGFSCLANLAIPLSQQFGVVLVYHFQSVATAAYWALYRDGELIREIESGDGEVFQNWGAPMAFEGDVPGHLVETSVELDGECFYCFDDSDIDAYNAACGVPSEVYGEYGSDWGNLVLPAADEPAADSPAAPTGRGWLGFWRR